MTVPGPVLRGRQIAPVHAGWQLFSHRAASHVAPSGAPTACLNGASQGLRFLYGNVWVAHKSNQVVSGITAHQTRARPMIRQADMMDRAAFEVERQHAARHQDTRLDLASHGADSGPSAVL